MVNVQLGDYKVLQYNVCSLGVHLDCLLTMRTNVQRIILSVVVLPAASVPIGPPIALRDFLFNSSPRAHHQRAGDDSLLAGMGDDLIAQLQSVMRVAARLVLRRSKFDAISADIRDRLHCLPIRSRIDFKLAVLVYKCLLPRTSLRCFS